MSDLRPPPSWHPGKQHPNDRQVALERWLKWTALALVVLLAVFIACYSSGCASTVTPDRVNARQASWDGNTQNSGWLGFLPDGSGHITANARASYNQLIAIYGRNFLPELRKDDGVKPFSDGTYSIDKQHLGDFMLMNEKHQAAIAPKKE
jgi:hypothetical protein